jgi:NADH-quinone oxidoreductase subunit G
VPLHEIYGTDELSMLSPPIAGRAPAPYLALGALDAERLGLQRGGDARVTLAPDGAPEIRLSLPVRLVLSLPAGLCGLPVGLPQLPFVDLPGEVGIEFGGATRYV